MASVVYRVYLTPEVGIRITATKLNIGFRRLWFFDEHNNLVALFKWEDTVGFSVEGSAEGQVITDRIPLEMGKVPEEEIGMSGRDYLADLRKQKERLAKAEREEHRSL